LGAFQQHQQHPKFQYSFQFLKISHWENDSIINSFHTTATNSLKPSWCTHTHWELCKDTKSTAWSTMVWEISNSLKPSWCTSTHWELCKDTKSTAWSAMVWEISTWQTKQNKLHCFMDRLG
jgi:hypothetical protein